MSSRIPPSASSPAIPSSTSKLPKFLQKSNRDRSRSINDPTASTTSIASSSSGGSNPDSHPGKTKSRRGSRLGGLRETFPASVDEPPVIIEPVPSPTPSNPFPRPRTRSERPISDIGHHTPHIYTNSPSPSLPTRLSGWFSHTFSASSTDLSLPSLLAQSQSQLASPLSPTKAKNTNALLMAARHGTRHLDKAVRYLLDSDAQPDRCTDPIWILGVQHPGYEPPPPPSPQRRSSVSVDSDITGSRRGAGPPSSYTYRSSPSPDISLSQSQPPSSSPSPLRQQRAEKEKDPAQHWPPIFYQDFTSRVWLTYRSQFSPIRDTSLAALALDSAEFEENPEMPMSPAKGNTRGDGTGGRWGWVGSLPIPGVGGEKAWTSDSGWGCMLRTGQSLLANALVHVYLGRDWRRPPTPIATADYALYVQILTWFLDSPSPLAPFSVHRMALAGKELGTDVGCWFGPSVAAGAIKTLVHAFPDAGLGVTVATDGCVYQSEVYAASTPLHPHSPRSTHSSRRHGRGERGWGGRAVLVLVGIRLGIDGVNPVYYETVKALYTFPQSVGIAGGRPSSSYYFVGSQADNLFYLDPHHARPAVPLRVPPKSASPTTSTANATPRQPQTPTQNPRSPTSPQSSRSAASSRAPLSPSPLQKQFSTSSQSTSSLPHAPASDDGDDLKYIGEGREHMERSTRGELDAAQKHYINAYSAAELKTFHCERVRKMPLSGLDPSMLIGFLCKDEKDWVDFRRRIVELGRDHKTIFTIQDEPPTWPSDSDEFMGLESISEPDDMDMEDEEDEEGREPFFDESRSPSAGAKSSEEDAIGPITPGPTRTAFDLRKGKKGRDEFEDDDDDDDEEEEEDEEDDDDDDDDDWVDPSVSTPIDSPRHQAPPMVPSKSSSSTTSSSGGSGVLVSSVPKKRQTLVAPIVRPPEAPAHYPFPSSTEDTPQQQPEESREENPTHRMHTARARDGGRTQSGGVKGVLTTDDGEPFS